MVVVLDAEAFTIDDASAVLEHVGGGDDARQVMASLLGQRFPLALMTEAPFSGVRVREAQAGDAFLSRSPDQIPGVADADFVLYVDSLHQYRARYPPNVMSPQPSGGQQAVRQDVHYRLWDAQVGAFVASGRVESEEHIPLVPNRRNYVGSVEEMAEKLTQELGIRTK